MRVASPPYPVSFTLKSGNPKTGPIPVSTTGAQTCPVDCALNGNGCYAQTGRLKIHWGKVTEGIRGTSWRIFCAAVALLPDGQIWRHNQAGDLPGDGVTIDRTALDDLARANRGKRGFTYTHYRPTRENLAAIRAAGKQGFVINLSADSLPHADQLARHRLPMVVVLPEAVQGNVEVYTPAGRRVVVCPQTYKEGLTCGSCGLCAVQTKERPIVGFPAHGPQKRKVDAIARGEVHA